MDRSDKLFAINQTLPGLECFLREVLGSEGLSADAEKKRQEFLKRLETVSTPPSLPPRPPQLPPRLHVRNDSPSGSRDEDQFSNSLYRNTIIDDPVAFASRQRELSRHYTFSKGYVGRKELFGEDSPLYVPQFPPSSSAYGQRDSIKSSSSDELYERLSFSGEIATLPRESFTPLPEEPNTSQDSTPNALGVRGGAGRGSGGKGKITAGWFKKEVKIYDEIRLSDIPDPVIQGYLRDVKSKQRRWCVLKDEKLYIFKSRDDPCSQIIDLPNCDIGVDDKKKISYSFSLRQSGAPLVQLAIEEGHDLSPWMSAIMAAAVRRINTYRPTSPLEKAYSIQPPKSPYGYMKINIPSNDDHDGGSTYEVPVESFSEMFKHSGYHSTPISEDSNEHYNPPLPPLPMDSDSSSESSSDEDEHEEDQVNIEEKKGQKQCSDKQGQSLLDDGTDSPSDHSTHYLSFGESFASDESKGEKGLRKRSSKALSNASLDSLGSASEMSTKQEYPPRKTSITNGPRTKRRRKQTTAESEAKFLQDPDANHSGVLFQKRTLGVWSKRYCKLMGSQFRCYRHADDEKASLTINLHDHDVSLIDSKESKKAYGFKVSHPTLESFYFATDSRVAVERWIELLSLAATGRQDIVAPYPPYFKADSADEQSKSQDSLNFDEDALESGDATDFTSDRSVRMDDDTSCFAADELDEDVSSDARYTREESFHPKLNQRRVKSPQRRSPRHTKGGTRERAIRRKVDKKRKESPYTPRTAVSDSGGESKTDGSDVRTPSNDSKKDKPKGWAESLKLKQSRFARGHSLTAMITGASPNELSKNRLNIIKKTNIQSYSRLLSLLDKEGRFSGFLTEVKVSKYSTTQLRRWCVVKNGVLNLYNKQGTDEEPAVKLNLAEMWLSPHDQSNKKYTFVLNDKDGRIFTFQVNSGKEDYDKWLEVLRVFTEIRVERPAMNASNSPDQEKGGPKGKEEGTSVNTFVKRPSIRMKFTQKVNVIDMFKRSQTYDFDDNPNSGEIPAEDVKCINYTGGQLTEVCVTEDHYTWSRVRWCTIRDSELLIYQDNECDDPIKRIVLYNIRLEEACEQDKDIYKFKIHRSNDTTTLIANNKTDYERWINQIHCAMLSYAKHDHENSKCRFPSPPRVFAHRRARSESLHKFLGSGTTSDISSTASSPEKRLSQLSFGSDFLSTSSEGSTDTLMNGHLLEIVPPSVTGSKKWCAVTSEYFFVYDSDDQGSPSRKIFLHNWKVREENSIYRNGFSLEREDVILLYQHDNKEVANQWLSVLQRYCQLHEDQLSPLVRCSKPTKSLSDDNLKGHLPNSERRSSLRKTLSEGKASGRKLLRKISEDNLLHKYRRSELFKVPWKGSAERMRDTKLRNHESSRERRFSCGSLFDNDGRFSGYLIELVTRPLCRSEVRRWCVLCDEYLSIYDQPRMENFRKQIPIHNIEIINESSFEENKFVLKLRHDEDNAVVFKMASRNEFEKWVAALSVKVNVLKSRRKRRGLVIDEEQSPGEDPLPRCQLAPPSIQSVSSSYASDFSTDTDVSVSRSLSNVSSDSVFSKRPEPSTQPSTLSTEGNSTATPVGDILRSFEKIILKDEEGEEASDDTLTRDSSVIDLGEVPWSYVEKTNEYLKSEIDSEPIYQNISIDTGPVYENVPRSALESSSGTLSSLTVEQIDLNSYEGKVQYRQFQKGLLEDRDESIFMDMLPKRSSEYDFGNLYENLQFIGESRPTNEVPLWSIRSSKNYEDVFVTSTQDSLQLSDDSHVHDRRSFASDYSGIVGENFLEEVGSCSTSRSGTLSSQTSVAEQQERAAFDKDLLGDILGLPVTAEEALEISEFCSECDQQTELERSDKRSSTLTNRNSEVFFDAFSDFKGLGSKQSSNDTQRVSVSSNDAHDTYFGPSSSEDESFTDCQGFTTAESSPYHKRYSVNEVDVNSKYLDDSAKTSFEEQYVETSKNISDQQSISLDHESNVDSTDVLIIHNERNLNTSDESVLDTDQVVVLRDKSFCVPPPARQELTKSQTEFIKAVTDAFEGINYLSLDDDEGEDTKL